MKRLALARVRDKKLSSHMLLTQTLTTSEMVNFFKFSKSMNFFFYGFGLNISRCVSEKR